MQNEAATGALLRIKPVHFGHLAFSVAAVSPRKAKYKYVLASLSLHAMIQLRKRASARAAMPLKFREALTVVRLLARSSSSRASKGDLCLKLHRLAQLLYFSATRLHCSSCECALRTVFSCRNGTCARCRVELLARCVLRKRLLMLDLPASARAFLGLFMSQWEERRDAAPLSNVVPTYAI